MAHKHQKRSPARRFSTRILLGIGLVLALTAAFAEGRSLLAQTEESGQLPAISDQPSSADAGETESPDEAGQSRSVAGSSDSSASAATSFSNDGAMSVETDSGGATEEPSSTSDLSSGSSMASEEAPALSSSSEEAQSSSAVNEHLERLQGKIRRQREETDETKETKETEENSGTGIEFKSSSSAASLSAESDSSLSSEAAIESSSSTASSSSAEVTADTGAVVGSGETLTSSSLSASSAESSSAFSSGAVLITPSTETGALTGTGVTENSSSASSGTGAITPAPEQSSVQGTAGSGTSVSSVTSASSVSSVIIEQAVLADDALNANIHPSFLVPRQREIASGDELKSRLSVEMTRAPEPSSVRGTANAQDEEIPVTWDVTPESGDYRVTVSLPNPFVPGTYHLSASLDTERGESRMVRSLLKKLEGRTKGSVSVIDTDVTLGFTALNIDRSLPLSTDSLTVTAALADSEGHALCGTEITVEAKEPGGALRTFQTKDKTIKAQKSCAARSFSTVPDYTLTVPLSSPGTTLLTMTEGEESFAEQVMVRESLEGLSVLRTSVTRSYPEAEEQTTIVVMPERTIDGSITERVPEGFEVMVTDPVAEEGSDEGMQTLTWRGRFEAGIPVTLRYTFRSPNTAPLFALFGPLKVEGTIVGGYAPPETPSSASSDSSVASSEESASSESSCSASVTSSEESVSSAESEGPVVTESGTTMEASSSRSNASSFSSVESQTQASSEEAVSSASDFSSSEASSMSEDDEKEKKHAKDKEEKETKNEEESEHVEESMGTESAPPSPEQTEEKQKGNKDDQEQALLKSGFGTLQADLLQLQTTNYKLRTTNWHLPFDTAWKYISVIVRNVLGGFDRFIASLVPANGDIDFSVSEPRQWQLLVLRESGIGNRTSDEGTTATLTLDPVNGTNFDAVSLPSFRLLAGTLSGSDLLDAAGNLKEDTVLRAIVAATTDENTVRKEVLSAIVSEKSAEIGTVLASDSAALSELLGDERRTSRSQQTVTDRVSASLNEGNTSDQVAEILKDSPQVIAMLDQAIASGDVKEAVVDSAVTQALGSLADTTLVAAAIEQSGVTADASTETVTEAVQGKMAEVTTAIRTADSGQRTADSSSGDTTQTSSRSPLSEVRSPSLISVKLKAKDGATFSPKYHFEKGSVILVLEPERAFTPGLYTLSMSVTNPLTNESQTLTQDFAWGVLAMNTNQDRYEVGDKAQAAIGVLDDAGEIVCDALVGLSVTAPSGDVTELMTADQSVRVTGTCGKKDSMNITPDYEAFFSVDEPGTYTLKLTAETKNGTREMTQKVTVTPQPGTAAAGDQIMGNQQHPSAGAENGTTPVIISRRAATRLYPFGPSPMEITVRFQEDFSGDVTEIVPKDFIVSNTEADGVESGKWKVESDEQTITWHGSWKAGDTATFSYLYDAPDVSPDFFTVGPLTFNSPLSTLHSMRELRAWSIANDAADLSLTLWAKKRKITISNANVDADLLDFPLSVKITADADIGTLGRSDGYDIRFASTTGALLKYEREEYHVSSGSGSGVFWVKIPKIDADTDTDFYIYYGRKDAGDGSSASSVWDSSFAGVWHLGEGDSTAANFYQDSTTNNNDGTLTDADGDSAQAAGQIANAMNFNGDADHISISDSSSLDSVQTANRITMEAWIKTTENSTGNFVVSRYDGVDGEDDWIMGVEGGNLKAFFRDDASWHDSGVVVNNGAWHHAVVEYDGTNILQYVDGTAGTPTTVSITMSAGNTPYGIGADVNNIYPFPGIIDDVRISSTARSPEWIKFEYQNMSSANQELTWEGTGTAAAEQVISGWPYKKKFTVSKTNVDGNLSNFPLYVKVRADSDLGRDALATGYDIRFTTSTGVLLPYEREQYHVRSGSGSGDFWVKVPTVKTATDTDLYMYYGKKDATDGSDPTNVWDSSFKGVWHLSESGNGTVDEYSDSTANDNDGTGGDGNAAYTPARASGMIGYGETFNGSNQNIQIPYAASLYSTTMTASFWAKSTITNYSSNGYPVSMYDYATNDRVWGAMINGNTDKWNIIDSSDGITPVNQDTSQSVTTSWEYLTFVTSDAGNTWTPYYNGSPLANLTSPVAYTDQGSDVHIGGLWSGSAGINSFNGTIDDVRISSVARSADWIKFEYHNMADSDNAITWETKTNTLDGWTLRKPITISKTNVDANLTDFPLYVKIRADTDLGASARSDGYDIRFTTSTGVILPYERENFHIRTGSGAGDFWVKVPQVSATANTLLYMYYGKADAANGEDKTNVWDSNFKGVWHLGQTSSGALSAADSTTNGNNGGVAGATNATGQVQGAGSFDGSQKITIPEIEGGTTNTASLWTTTANVDVLIGKTAYNVGGYYLGIAAGVVYYSANGTYVGSSETIPSLTTLMYLTVVRNGTTVKFFTNGSQLGMTQTLSSDTSGPDVNTIGAYSDGGHGSIGTLDEIRISSTARSAEWVKFEYQNMASATNEITVGTSQSAVITGTVYSDRGTTALAGKTVRVAVNGVDLGGTAETNAAGLFTMSGSSFVTGDLLTFYLEDETQDAVTVMTASGGSMTGVDLYQDNLIIRSDSGGSIVNSQLLTAAVSGETDISNIYTVDSGVLNVKSGKNLLVWANRTFTPGGNVNAGSGVIIRGTLTLGTNTATLSGSWLKKTGGGFTISNSTVILDGANQTMSGSTTFYNLTKSVTSADTLTIANGTTQTVAGTLTLNGAASNLLSLRSSVSGSQWNLYPSGTASLSYLDVKDGNNTASTVSVTNGTDSGNSDRFGFGWYKSWTNRKKITISEANVDATLTDFPLLVAISQDTSLGNYAQADGDDLRFTDSLGAPLRYEKEDFRVRSGSGSGNFWVKVPTISSSADTDIYVYYGSGSAADGQSAANVWDSNFKGVWHLNDNAANTTVANSTSTSGINGTAQANTNTKTTTGQDDGALTFNGTSDYIAVADNAVLDVVDNFSVTMWVNLPSNDTTNNKGLWDKDYGNNIPGLAITQGGTAQSVQNSVVMGTSGVARDSYTSMAVPLNQWAFIVVTKSGATRRLYINGIDYTVNDVQRIYQANSAELRIQRRGATTGVGNVYTQGNIDEVRISSTARSAAWVKFEYANMGNAGNELSFGGTQTTITGTAYSDAGVTPLANQTVRLAINGTDGATAETNASGVYSLTGALTAGDILTVYLEDETADAVTVTNSSGGSLAGINLYQNELITRSDNSSPLTNANLLTAAVSGETDISGIYAVASGNLTTAGGKSLYVPTSQKFTPGGNVTVGGSFQANGATFTMASGTLTMNGTTSGLTFASGSGTIPNLTFNGTGGSWSLGSTLSVTSTLTMTAGTLSQGGYSITAGAYSQGGGTFTGGTKAITINGSFTQTVGSFTNSSGGMSITGNFTKSGGTYADSGTITFDSRGYGYNSTVRCGGSLGGTVIFTKNTASWENAVKIATGCSVTVDPNSTATFRSLQGDQTIAFVNSGTIIIPSGTWTVSGYGPFLNYGTISYSGTGWYLNNEFTNETQGVIEGAGANISVRGAFTQNGTFDMTGKTMMFDSTGYYQHSTLYCSGAFGGTVDIAKIHGSNFTLASGCSINLGPSPTTSITPEGAGGAFTNNGTIVIPSGTWTVSGGGSLPFVNYGTITHNGNGSNISATFTNATGATINLSGSTLNVTSGPFANYGTLQMTGDQATLTTPTLGAHAVVEYTATSGSRAIKNWTYGNLSIYGTGGTLSLPAAITATGVTIKAGTLSLSGSNLTVSGTFTVNSGATLKLQGGETVTTPTLNAGSTVAYNGTSGPYTIGNWTYKNLEIAGTGATFNLPATPIFANSITLVRGTLDATADNYDLYVNGDWTLKNAARFNARGGTVNLIGQNQTMSGSTSFWNLSKTALEPSILNFAAGTTQTVSGSLAINGSAGNGITMRSTQTGTRWKINPLGSLSMSYVDMKDSENLAAPFDLQNLNNTDSGNNQGFGFGWYWNWPYRKKITISEANVDETLTNFPLAVKINQDALIGSRGKADGTDLRFTDANGAALSYERENYSVSSGSGSGNFWVKVPSISSSTDTDIYVYYGSGSAADGQDATNVWDSNFKGVWHLKETGTNPTVYDSTSNANNSTTQTWTPTTGGKIDGAGSFNGTSQYMDFGTPLSSHDGWTMEAWTYGGTNMRAALGLGDSGSVPDGAVFPNYGGTTRVYQNNVYRDSGVQAPSGWMHSALTRTSSSVGSLFINGTEYSANPTGVSTDNLTFNVGRWNAPLTMYFDSLIDEVRISNTARSAPWIKFEYNNQNSADQELTWEGQVATTTITGTVYSDEGTTALGSQTVRAAVNGVDTTATAESDPTTGAFSLSGVPTGSGNIVTLYLEDETADGVTVTVGSGGNLSGIDLYKNHLIIRSSNGTSIVNSQLSTAAVAGEDDISNIYTVDAGVLNVKSGKALYSGDSGTSFVPGGNVNVGSGVTIQGTMSLGTNMLTMSGSFLKKTNGVFTVSNSTVVLDGTNQTMSGSTTFYNLTKSVTSAATLTFGNGTTQTVAGTFTLNGAASNLLSLRSSVSGSQWSIYPSGTASLSYVDIQDGNNTYNSFSVTNGTDSGNNDRFGFGWYKDFSNRKKITIDQTNVDADLTDFPLLVALSADTSIGTNAQSDGDDIRFTDSLGSPLRYEKEDFRVRSGSGSGNFWVKVPTISSSADTDIYVYYGSGSAADGASRTQVWDSNFKGVWHMSGSTLSTIDSTSNANNGTNNGATATTGKVDGGANFSGTAQYITVASDGTGKFDSPSYTLDHWFYIGSVVNYPILWSYDYTSHGTPFYAQHLRIDTNGVVTFNWNASGGTPYQGISTPVSTVAQSNWYHIVATYTSGSQKIYVNGVQQASGTRTDTITYYSQPVWIGKANFGVTKASAQDEVRFSSVARSADWIKFEYANSGNAGNELSFGGTQTTITGTAYSDAGVTPLANQTVRLAINGTDNVTAETNASGQYTMSGLTLAAGNILTLYLEDETADAVTVTNSSGTSLTGINLYQNELIVRSDNSSPIANSQLLTAAVSGETDISGIYAVASGNLTTVTGKTLFVATGALLTPGGTISVGTSGTTSAMVTYGTVNMGTSALTVYGNFTQSNGTFNGGSAANTFNGNYTLNGGTFTATSGTMTFGNSSAYTSFSHTAGGTFNHNNGTVAFRYAFNSINVNNTETFNNLIINNGGYSIGIAGADTLIVNGALTLTNGGIAGGTLNAKGTISIAPTFDGGYGTFLIDGSGDQSFTVPNGALLPGITLNNASTTIDFENGASVPLYGNFTLQAGIFTCPSGTLTFGTSAMYTSFTHTAGGTFNHNNGTVVISQYVSNIDVNATETFYNLIFNKAGGLSTAIASGDTLVVNGMLTLTDGTINTGAINAKGAISVGVDWDGGNSAYTLSGTGAQTFTNAGGTMPSGTFTINKTSGAVTLASDLVLNTAGQDLALTSGTLNLNGNNLTVNDQFTIASAGTLKLKGSETLSKNPTSNAGTVNYSDSATYSSLAAGNSYTNLTFSGSGLWKPSAAVTVSGNLTVGTGSTFDVHGKNTTITSTFENAGTLALSGNESTFTVTNDTNSGLIDYVGTGSYTGLKAGNTYNNVRFNGTNGTWTLNNALTVNKNLTISGGTLDVSGTNYGVNVAGNWTKNSGAGFTARSGTVTLNGTNQTMSGSTTFNNLTKSVSSADTLTLAAGTLQTISGTLTLNGASGQALALRSSQTGNQWKIDPQGTRTVSYLDVKDSENTNTTAITCSTGCTPGGNLINWTSGTLLSLTGIAATPASATATVTWTTDAGGSSRVQYGPMTQYGMYTAETNTSPLVTSHTVSLTNLISCATYHYRVLSKDVWNYQAASANKYFSTTGCTGNGTIGSQSGAIIPKTITGSVALRGTGTGVTLTVPPGSFTQPEITYQINQIPPATVFATVAAPSGMNIVGQTYQFVAMSGSTVSVSSFEKPLTVSIQYAAAEIDGLDESTLWIQRYDGSQWHKLDDCTVDSGLMTVTCTTTEFSTFGLFGASASTGAGGGAARTYDLLQELGFLSPDEPAADSGLRTADNGEAELGAAPEASAIAPAEPMVIEIEIAPDSGQRTADSGIPEAEIPKPALSGAEGSEVRSPKSEQEYQEGVILPSPPKPIITLEQHEEQVSEVQEKMRQTLSQLAAVPLSILQSGLRPIAYLWQAEQDAGRIIVNGTIEVSGVMAQGARTVGRQIAQSLGEVVGVAGDGGRFMGTQLADGGRLIGREIAQVTGGVVSAGQRSLGIVPRLRDGAGRMIAFTAEGIQAAGRSLGEALGGAGRQMADGTRLIGNGIAGGTRFIALGLGNAATGAGRQIALAGLTVFEGIQRTEQRTFIAFQNFGRSVGAESRQLAMRFREGGGKIQSVIALAVEGTGTTAERTSGAIAGFFETTVKGTRIIIAGTAEGTTRITGKSVETYRRYVSTLGRTLALWQDNVHVGTRRTVAGWFNVAGGTVRDTGALAVLGTRRGIAGTVETTRTAIARSAEAGLSAIAQGAKVERTVIAWRDQVGETFQRSLSDTAVGVGRRFYAGIRETGGLIALRSRQTIDGTTELIARGFVTTQERGGAMIATGVQTYRRYVSAIQNARSPQFASPTQIAGKPAAPLIAEKKYRTALQKKNGSLLIATLHVGIFDSFGDPFQQTPVVLFSTPKIATTDDEGIATFHEVETGLHRLEIHVKNGPIQEKEIILEPPSGLTVEEQQRLDVLLPVLNVVINEPAHGSATILSRLTPLAWSVIALLLGGNVLLGFVLYRRRMSR